MKKLLPFIILILALGVPAQKRCLTKLAAFPAMRGLKLDMAKSAITKSYPEMKFIGTQENAGGIILKSQIKNTALSENIDSIFVLLQNDKVISFQLTYDKTINWVSIKEFTQKISDSLSMSKAVWQSGESPDTYFLPCSDFFLSTSYDKDKNPRLLVSRNPEKKKPDQKKKVFKP